MKNKKAMKKNEKNSIHLKGLVYTCSAATGKSGGRERRSAALVIATAAKDGDTLRWQYHRVGVSVTRKMGALMNRMADDIESNRANYGREGYVPKTYVAEAEGSIRTVGGETFIDAESVKFALAPPGGDGVAFVNEASVTGTVEDVLVNNNYASVILRSDGVRLPLILSRNDDRKGYEEAAAGTIKKGDEVSLAGPLCSRTYSNGRDTTACCMLYNCTYSVRHKMDRKQQAQPAGVTM